MPTLPLSVEEFREKVRRYPVDSFATQVRAGRISRDKVPTGRISPDQVPIGRVPTGEVPTDKVPWSAQPIENSSSRFHVLEISGFQVAAAVFLFAAFGLAVWTTVGRVPVGKRLPTARESTPVAAAQSPAPLSLPAETTSPTSPPPAANTSLMPEIKPPALATPASRPETPSAQSLNARSQDSTIRPAPAQSPPTVTTRSLADSGASPSRPGSTALIARNTPPPANSQPVLSPKAVGSDQCRANQCRAGKSRNTHGNPHNASHTRSAAPVIASHTPRQWHRRRQQTVQDSAAANTHRRLLFVCDDLATFCFCFS